MAEDKMENGYELWLKCCDNTKSGEVRRFLEVPNRRFFKGDAVYFEFYPWDEDEQYNTW